MAAPSTTDPITASLPPDRQRTPDSYAIDGVTPAVALRPESREEVAAVLDAASEAGAAVVPQGGRTALSLGRPLDAYDVALDLTGLHRIVAYEPDDLTITVEAGLTLAALQQRLGEHGQFLSADPPPDDGVTVGGLLATARPGAWRGHLPGARDLILGIEAATAEGTLVKSGGRVVKNVSGYDLHRLHTGALGAFGVIVEASFKLAPLPAATRSLALRCETVAVAGGLANDVWDRSLTARAISVLGAPASAAAGLAEVPHVLVEFAGVVAAVDEAMEVAAALGDAHDVPGGAWAALRSLAASDGVVLRMTVPATAVGDAIEAAEGGGCTAWGHVAAGSVLAQSTAIDAAGVRALRSRVRSLGGTLQIESAPAAMRAEVDPFDGGDHELLVALRQQFDESKTINRGRWAEGL
ncbi:MAG: FAD-binding oxidoreductase [Dehalococcoidia bacterium]